MTTSSQDILDMSHKIDSLKDQIGLITHSAKDLAYTDEEFSLFPLYMTFAKNVDYDILEYESESVREIVGNILNGDRINAVISSTANNDVWVNVLAFDMFVDAATNRDITPGIISPDYADELIIGMINIAGVEGSEFFPIKTNIVAFIKACLDHDGWDIPPLPLMFSHIVDIYEDKEHIKEVKHLYGDMSIIDISNYMIDSSTPLYMQNYMLRNKEVATIVIDSFKKTLSDWAEITERR